MIGGQGSAPARGKRSLARKSTALSQAISSYILFVRFYMGVI
ncbi:hypothetical protein [Priestia megaterium]|nr:hypothetical protein [Priestia megaterium]